jgi:DNA-binding PadR family transcriptional regulator
MAEFLNDISILEANLREVKIEKSDVYIPAFKESINSIYRNINKIEDDCYIDASVTKLGSTEVFNKIGQMEALKDQKQFDEKTSDILTDLSRIRYGVVQKIKDCSK